MSKLNALIIGTGEYSTGYVHGSASTSDKGAGVIALSLFELRRQGMLDVISMAGTNGTKFPGIREHLENGIGKRYQGFDTTLVTYPSDETSRDTEAYLVALDATKPGDMVFVFTPDDTHFTIAMEAVQRGCHVLIAKPIVKTIEEHIALREAARENGVLVAMEVHKRWDPIYADARDRISQLGDFSYFSAYMSQPKSQLKTFAAWAGKASDISYYLNAHHVDFNVWAAGAFARPVGVHAMASTGVAKAQGIPTEDTITLSVTWENMASGNKGTAIYTSSWIAAKSDVHSQQRFFYMGHDGEVTVDQAHRGFTTATDEAGFASPNPLFMKYAPDGHGRFAGQGGYGFKSIEEFAKAVEKIVAGQAEPADFDGQLATIDDTLLTTAVLHAGRKSLDEGGAIQTLIYDAGGGFAGLESRPK
ncbi:Gfo/Idh/MocA family protein [Haloferula chungangensis]|uniref:Gfo/Idh/MocA family protein n=1 Tax=Haloferula chungangensis TaxID=1048331 RepID=A0ABW2L4M8_9BACT